jgi:hypothetical protein
VLRRDYIHKIIAHGVGSYRNETSGM